MSDEVQHAVSLEREGRGWILRTHQRINRPLDEVFEVFSRAENLERITPRQLRFKILTPLPIEMKPGVLLDYQLRIWGVPLRWRTRIPVWEPPFRFTDEQLRGPYLWWVHEHTFETDGCATIVRDSVRYGVPGGAIIHHLCVRRKVLAIFRYRASALERYFGPGSMKEEPAADQSARDGLFVGGGGIDYN